MDWVDFFGGVAAGVLTSVIVGTFWWLLRWNRNRTHFGCLAGTYRVREKAPSEDTDGTVTVAVRGSTLRFVWTLADGSKATGEITMNERSRTTGSGSYSHLKAGNVLWGDLWVRVEPRKPNAARLLVDGRYTRQDSRQSVPSAWVWEMQQHAENGLSAAG